MAQYMNWEDRTADYYIRKALHSYDMGQLSDEIDVDRVYRELVGDLISRLTLRLSFRKGTLRLRYAAAALRQEMSFRSESLRTKINERLGAEVVKKIVIAP